MYFKSKNISLLILGITSVLVSRTMFWFLDDLEGPNLLVVMVMAVIIYFLSLAAYFFSPSAKSILQYFSFAHLAGLKRLLLAIFIQIIIATTFLFLSELKF